MRRNEKDALDAVLALLRFGGALLLYGACRVAQGGGGEEYECEVRDGDKGALCPRVVLGGVGPVLPYRLVLDDEGGQKESYTRKETDSGDDEPDPCLRCRYVLTLPSSPVSRVC